MIFERVLLEMHRKVVLLSDYYVSQQTDCYIGETLNTSPPPCWFIWFVNTPQVMTDTMQVKKQIKVCVEKKYMQFCVRRLDSNLRPAKL